MSTKVTKRSNQESVSKVTQQKWKLASYHGMYGDMAAFTGISETTLRNAIKGGIATPETEVSINRFFEFCKSA